MKRVWRMLAGALIGCLVLVGNAAQAESLDDAQDLVKSTSLKVLEMLAERRAEGTVTMRYVLRMVDEHVVPSFDQQVMAQLALGKHWRTANAKQRDEFVAQFRSLLIRTYGTALTHYSDQKLEFQPVRPGSKPTLALVRSEIIPSSGPPIPIHYRLRFSDGKWRVYDVVIEGISMVTSYRNEYNTRVSQIGIDGLIAEMRGKNAANSAQDDRDAASAQ